jgi:hypothetical protein
MPGRHVEVVLKVAERCNIDCTYCYMFNKGDESFRRKPKQLSIGAAADTRMSAGGAVRGWSRSSPKKKCWRFSVPCTSERGT